jgi:hypothetical protein
MQIPYKPLDLSTSEKDKDGNVVVVPSTVALRYRPLPALSCADYLERHVHLLESSGAFDSLTYGAHELRIGGGTIDLSGLAALGKAFSVLLSKSVGDAKTLRALIISHCKEFDVEIEHEGTHVKLDTVDAINTYLDFDQCVAVVIALSGGVLRPLWNRLRSSDVAKRSESPKPSTETSSES